MAVNLAGLFFIGHGHEFNSAHSLMIGYSASLILRAMNLMQQCH